MSDFKTVTVSNCINHRTNSICCLSFRIIFFFHNSIKELNKNFTTSPPTITSITINIQSLVSKYSYTLTILGWSTIDTILNSFFKHNKESWSKCSLSIILIANSSPFSFLIPFLTTDEPPLNLNINLLSYCFFQIIEIFNISLFF